jgi:hypothetical protein
VRRRSAVQVVLASALVAATTASSLATAGPPATSAIAVEVQADNLTGLRPNGTTVVFHLQATAAGPNPSSLHGAARQVGSGGALSYWPATGSVDGNIIALAGVVAGSNASFLVGSPMELEADSSTGAMTLTFGPLAGGPFAGQTIVAQGVGSVSIRTDDT